MKKNGFTLIELMGVVIVLGVVALIVVPGIKQIIDNAKQKGFEKQVSIIIESAESWAMQNTDALSDNVPTLVQINTLKTSGFLENKEIINPIDKEEMNGCVKITYNENYNNYEYEYIKQC